MVDVASNSVEEEFLWSCTLTGSDKEFQWSPEDPSDEDDDDNDPTVKPGHRLLIKNAILMPTATNDEVSIIEIETEGYNKTKVVVPIVAMRGGSDYNQYVDLLVPAKRATFKLIQGSGPISLVGSHCVDFYGYRDVGAGDAEDEDEEGEEGEDAKKDDDAKKSSPAKGEKKTPSKEKTDKKTPVKEKEDLKKTPVKEKDEEKKTPKEGGSGGKKRKASEEKASSQEKKKKDDK